MSAEEINIAIHEAIGGYVERWSTGQVISPLPNYCGDLNAMHTAEKALSSHTGGKFGTKTQLQEYYCVLRELVSHLPESPIVATAAQRAEAFLKTLNLWKQ